MMKDAQLYPRGAPTRSSWSNRVLLLSLAGIFFLTLYPFRFEHQGSARFLFPFSLNGWGKGTNALDIFLNVLLFIPFGFGLAEKLREHGRSKKTACIIAYIAGALLSYLVEFLQIYIPHRDSGWTDVITNSSGALVGAWILESAGAGIVAWFNARERELESWLTLPKIGVLCFLYIGFWCVLVGPLQKQAKLMNWTRDSFLAIGDSASLRAGPAWKGRMIELDVWNHAVPAEAARQLTSEQSIGHRDPVPLIAYRFSGSAPFQDQQHFLSSLDWASGLPATMIGDGVPFDGRSWLISTSPVPTLVSSIESSGQFALRVVCKPAENAGVDARRIVSISSPSGAANLELSQYNSTLAFWFRNRFSMRRYRMTWVIPRVFVANEIRNVLVSFDGSAASLYVDGRPYGYAYDLGPGVALAHYIRRVKSAELGGYKYILYAMIFLPAGCLLGFAWRRSGARWITRLVFLLAGVLLPAVIVEYVLANAASRTISLPNICFSALLVVAGGLWINADRVLVAARHGQHEPVSVG